MKHQRRNYGQYCGLAAALDVLGERWTLLVVRELLTGPCRYNEMLANLPGIGTNLLADRLKFLAEQEVILQRPQDGTKTRTYELTDKGESLRPAVLALARWGLGVLEAPEAEEFVRPRWGVLAVEAMIDSGRAGPDEQYEFRLDDEVFHVSVADGAVRVQHGMAPDTPALVVHTERGDVRGDRSRTAQPVGGDADAAVVMEGDPDAVLRCSRLLGLMG